MTRRPEVSIVVPFYDSAEYIDACIDSLLAQEGVEGPYEIVLIDNGSSDGADRIAERRAHEALGVTLLREATPGAYRARNAGIVAAKAPLLAFTDADCCVAPSWLSEAQRMMLDKTVGIVVGDCLYPRHASWFLRILGAYENAKTKYVVEQCPPSQHYAYANNMVVRASLFSEIGPFEEWQRAADSELVHRMATLRPDLRLAFNSAMRVTHLEFLQARARLGRLRLYTTTNSKISSFQELSLRQRLAVAFRALSNS